MAGKKPDNDTLIKWIYKKNGNLNEVAKVFGVVRQTVYNWVKKNKKIKEAVDDANEILLDFAESQAAILARGIPELNDRGELIGWKEKPDGPTIRFLLATKGKNRGYGQNLDVTSGGEKLNNQPFIINIKTYGEEDTETD